jgi:hypothetical protein
MDKGAGLAHWVNCRYEPKQNPKGPRAMRILELFVNVDDFCQSFWLVWEKKLISDGSNKRRRKGPLSISKIMTLIIYFHQSQ